MCVCVRERERERERRECGRRVTDTHMSWMHKKLHTGAHARTHASTHARASTHTAVDFDDTGAQALSERQTVHRIIAPACHIIA